MLGPGGAEQLLARWNVPSCVHYRTQPAAWDRRRSAEGLFDSRRRVAQLVRAGDDAQAAVLLVGAVDGDPYGARRERADGPAGTKKGKGRRGGGAARAAVD
eukprot:gene6791-biopygen1130